MNPALFAPYIDSVSFTGKVSSDATAVLQAHQYNRVASHVAQVAATAKKLARQFGESIDLADVGGWLHDISVIIPDEQRVGLASQLGVEVLAEEAAFPMILHQKLSVAMARDLFGVHETAVLDAIGCHTTLRKDATRLDMVLFLADKISWDQTGTPPYLDALTRALAVGLETAVFVYLDHLWRRRDALRVVHPWFIEAYWQLRPFSSTLPTKTNIIPIVPS